MWHIGVMAYAESTHRHLITVDAAADLLRVGRCVAYRAAVRGELPIVLTDGRVMVIEEVLRAELGLGRDRDQGRGCQ